MKVIASQIADIIQATIIGDPNTEVAGFGKIEEAKEGELTFLANAKYLQFLEQSKASVIILNQSFVKEGGSHPATLLVVEDAYAAFTTLLQAYQSLIEQGSKKQGIHAQAYVSPEAKVEASVFIDALAYIGAKSTIDAGTQIHPQVYIGNNVTIGKNCTIYPGAKVLDNCILGNEVILHAGVVIGADGFGFAPNKEGIYSKVPQLGNVVIESHVEIGANTTIDRATMGSTIISTGVKIDNLVQIAHNVQVAAHTVIAAQAGISGSTKIGKHCVIGGQAGIVGHISLAEGTKINAQSGVSKTVSKPNTALTGTPAYDYYQSIKSQALVRQLPEMYKRIEQIESKIKSEA